MLGRLLTRLNYNMLKLYPDRFLDEFGGEMDSVFAQALSGLDESRIPVVIRKVKMIGLFFREVWSFPLAYLEARRYQFSLDAGETPANGASYREGQVVGTWVSQRASWGEALVGTLPFLLFGLAYLLEGFTLLDGHRRPVFTMLGASLNHPAIMLTLPMGVYFACVLGLLFGALKVFPRWSYSYLGMSLYFGWYYSNGRFYGVTYDSWAWLPSLAVIILSLLLTRSLQPLVQLVRGAWNDWTRLSFAVYSFILPILTIVFFDDDWGITQLYGLIFDTLLLAAGAVAFLRSRTIWGRVLSLQAVVLILVVKGTIGGWLNRNFWASLSFLSIFLGLLLLPALIGLLRRGMEALSSR